MTRGGAGLLPAGIILTGGASQLAGVADLGRDVLQIPVRIASPTGVGGLVDTLLTPAYGEGLTCYVEIMWMGRPEGWEEFSSELCREWLKEPGALPHWSKEFEHVEDVVSIMRANLGDRRDRFLAALDRSGIDPERRFANALVRRVLLDAPPEG